MNETAIIEVQHKRVGGRLKIKPKRWAHQHELESNLSKPIIIRLNNGENLCGTLINADQFTLQIDADDSSVLTVFKSSICLFWFD